jgi:hypothetical protein
MPLFLEVHTIDAGASIEEVATAHVANLPLEARFGVRSLRYWVDEQHGKVFCLVEAPSGEAAASVHRQSRGFGAAAIYPVKEGL